MAKEYKPKGFLLYEEDEELFNELTDEQKGEVIKSLFAYFSRGEMPQSISEMSRIVFYVIKRSIDRDVAHYVETCERKAESRKKAWAKKGKVDEVHEVHQVDKVDKVDIETKTKTKTQTKRVLVLDKTKTIPEARSVEGSDLSGIETEYGKSDGKSDYHRMVEKMFEGGDWR